MTVAEILQRLSALYPKACTPVWAATWGPIFADALGRAPPLRLDEAFRATMRGWTYATPPKPGDFAKHLGSTEDRPGKAAAGDHPLPLGRRHFEACRRVAADVLARWIDAHPDLADTYDPLALACQAEAGKRARAIANAIVREGRDHAGTATIAWNAEDRLECAARVESQRAVRDPSTPRDARLAFHAVVDRRKAARAELAAENAKEAA